VAEIIRFKGQVAPTPQPSDFPTLFVLSSQFISANLLKLKARRHRKREKINMC